MSTREMGPGTRLDTLDDQWGVGISAFLSSWVRHPCYVRHIALRDFTAIGETLMRRLETAIVNAVKQRQQHNDFTATFPATIIAEWTSVVDCWNEDPTNAENPYFEEEERA